MFDLVVICGLRSLFSEAMLCVERRACMAAVEGQNRRSWHWQIFKLRFCGAVLDATVNWSLQQSKLSAEIVLLFFYFLLTFIITYCILYFWFCRRTEICTLSTRYQVAEPSSLILVSLRLLYSARSWLPLSDDYEAHQVS